MIASTSPPLNVVPVDPDLAEQARPGHGIPSQDPAPAAQQPLDTGEADREAQSVMTGGGMMVGAATGAAIGATVAGPVGVVVGGTLGGVAGVLGGSAAGQAVNPKQPEEPRDQPKDRLHKR
jgi:hypothetical protein